MGDFVRLLEYGWVVLWLVGDVEKMEEPVVMLPCCAVGGRPGGFHGVSRVRHRDEGLMFPKRRKCCEVESVYIKYTCAEKGDRLGLATEFLFRKR